MKDVLDLIIDRNLNSVTDLKEFIAEPLLNKTTRGVDLFGFQTDQISKAALYYHYYLEHLELNEANQILSQLKITIAIEELALLFKRALFLNAHRVNFLQNKMNIKEVVLELYKQFSGLSYSELNDLIERKQDIYRNKWFEIVPDEDNVTPEQLGCFYNSLPFPVGCLLINCLENSLTAAYRTLPILLARSNNSKRVFDYGGNSGQLTSAMANSLELNECMLIEENEILLNFAKWRDDLFNVKNVSYKKESELINCLDSYNSYFDLGICTEVLEHVYYVEETVNILSKILRTGGLLYLTASFGLYPEPSHLKKNIKYYGKEDELMKKFGFERVNAQFPIPLLSSVLVYRKN